MENVESIANNVRIGCWHEVGLCHKYSNEVRFERYKILSLKKHNEYTYSMFCVNIDEKGVERCIYEWIVPSYSNQVNSRVVSVKSEAPSF